MFPELHTIEILENFSIVLCKFSVWDLEKKTLSAWIEQAHRKESSALNGGIASLHFADKEPVLMSVGRDNAIKQWIFDNEDGSARLLRSREGILAIHFFFGNRYVRGKGREL